MEMSKKDITNRLFSTLIILFFVTPFLFIIYGQIQQYIIGINIKEILETNPYLNIIFITSFITPFIGFYMLHLKQALEKDLSREVFIIQLSIVAISFLIMGNYTYGLFISILIYFMGMKWKVGVKKACSHLKKLKFSFNDWLVPIVLLVIATLIRFMLTLVSNS